MQTTASKCLNNFKGILLNWTLTTTLLIICLFMYVLIAFIDILSSFAECFYLFHSDLIVKMFDVSLITVPENAILVSTRFPPSQDSLVCKIVRHPRSDSFSTWKQTKLHSNETCKRIAVSERSKQLPLLKHLSKKLCRKRWLKSSSKRANITPVKSSCPLRKLMLSFA